MSTPTPSTPVAPTTVEELLAHEQIRRLKARYCDLCDRARLPEVAGLFTPDGVCDLGATSPDGPMHGREAIAAGFGRYAGMARPWGTLHRVSNPLVELAADGGSATGTWYLDEAMPGGPGPGGSSFLMGVYHDQYRRVDGTWLIAASRLEVLWSAPMPG